MNWRRTGNYSFFGLVCRWVIACAVVSNAHTYGGQIWSSDFNIPGGFDAMTEFQDGNPGKSMFDPAGASGSVLRVQLEDGITFGGQHDKGGRALGGAVGAGAASFSGYYKFAWSQLAETSVEVYTAAGFLGDAQVHISREFIGSVIRSSKQGGDYIMNIGGYFGGVGVGYSGYKSGGATNLGPDALDTTYQFVVSWDAGTHVLRCVLFDQDGLVLADNTGDLDSASDYPNLHVLSQSVLDADINATQIRYLGWQDYIGNANLQTIVWDVDRVAYFDTAEGAFGAVETGAAPTGACCLLDGTCQEDQTQSACSAAAGTWQGAGTTCAQATCHPFDPGTEPWEVFYDGVGSAADGVPNHLRWDSPFDDDWNQPGVSFRLNTPAVGFMSVDRVTNPADHGKTGNIWFRDPILTYADGLTLEVRVLIKPNSNTDAFSITSLDDGGSLGVHLSPNRIKAGDLGAAGSGTIAAFDTTDTYHLYRVVRLPGSHVIRVYIDNSPIPFVSGNGSTQYASGAGDPYLEYPRILIGDNENNTAYNANYTLDFVRYRRGASAPGQPPGTFPARALPPLPSPAPDSESFTDGYEGVGEPLTSGWIQGGASAWTQQAGGIMELNTFLGAANARRDTIATWPNKEAVTIEARIKVLPDSLNRAFNLLANDQMGGVSLTLSPDKAELMHSYLPAGYATFAMNTTDDFHVYRLTRAAHGLYWHLYVDDYPTPVVAHQHAEGDLISFSRIWFGDVGFPIPANACHVLIDYIRWHQGTSAPPSICHSPPADGDGDGDVDMDDFAELQRCLTGPGGGLLEGCTCFDAVSPSLPTGDKDVDQDDLVSFLGCLGGADLPPACGD